MAEAPDPDQQDFFGPSGPMSSATAAAAGAAQPTGGQPRQQQQQEQRRLHSLGSPSMQEDAEMDGACVRAFTGSDGGVGRRVTMTPTVPYHMCVLYTTDLSVPQEPLTPTVFEGTGGGLGALNFTTLSPGLQREVWGGAPSVPCLWCVCILQSIEEVINH